MCSHSSSYHAIVVGDYLLSAPGTVVVRVSSVNDPPAGVSEQFRVSEESGIPSTLMIQLNETEPSNEKAPNYFYTVQQFPTFGTLQQVLDVDQVSINGSRCKSYSQQTSAASGVLLSWLMLKLTSCMI